MHNRRASRAGTPFLILALIVAAGSGRSAASQAGAHCRTYPTLSTSTVSRGGSVAETISTTCTKYNTATNQISCTITQTGPGISLTVVIASTYTSLADFVDEVRVIPPLTLPATIVMSPPSGPSPLRRYTYDSQRRMIRSVTVTAGMTHTETHTAWDTAGRSTKVTTTPASGPTSTTTNAYDDVARTLTITTSGVSGTITLTFDPNGNLLTSVASSNGITTTTGNTVTATDRICY